MAPKQELTEGGHSCPPTTTDYTDKARPRRASFAFLAIFARFLSPSLPLSVLSVSSVVYPLKLAMTASPILRVDTGSPAKAISAVRFPDFTAV